MISTRLKSTRCNLGIEPKYYDLADGRMAVWHYGPTDRPIDVVFLHANGFNGLTYRKLFEGLDVHVAAPDLRGHGRSELPTDQKRLKSFQPFADDAAEFIELYVERPVSVAGHSFGAVSGVLAAPRLKDKIAAYVGFDPASLPLLPRLFPRLPGGRAMMKRSLPIAKTAGRRRFIFDSFEAAYERYKGRGAFKTIPDDILRDYLTAGLKPHPDGVQLSCHPLWEQAVFVAQTHNLYRCAPALPKNSRMIFGGGRGAVSTPGTRRALGRSIGQSNITFERGFSHMFPLQEVEFCRATLQGMITEAGLG